VQVDKLYIVKSPPKSIEKLDVPQLRILGSSIVAYSPKGAPKPEKNPVVVISVATNSGAETQLVAHNFNDKPVLETFIKCVRDFDPDIIVGCGTNCQDWPYLTARAKKLGVNLSLTEPTRNHILAFTDTFPLLAEPTLTFSTSQTNWRK